MRVYLRKLAGSENPKQMKRYRKIWGNPFEHLESPRFILDEEGSIYFEGNYSRP